MTVENQTKKVTGTGNDSATVFSFSPIVIFASTNLVVTKLELDGTETVLAKGTSSTTYSVAPITSYPGTGSITYPASGGTPLATGEFITIKRVLTLEQLTDLENQGGYHADTQETVYDKLLMIDLQQQEEIDRSFRFPVTYAGGITTETDSPAANEVLKINSAGTAMVWAALSAGVMAASDSVAQPVSLTAGAAGTGADYSRDDHVHLLPTVSIAKGGTGAVTASAARTNLGLGTADTVALLGLTLTSLDAGAGAGPVATMQRLSASPAVSDLLAHIPFKGNTDAPSAIEYAGILVKILDPIAANATGELNLRAATPGGVSIVAKFSEGVQVGSPFGAYKGLGTGNFQYGVYDDGKRLGITLDTEQDTSSGSSFTFGSIPAGVKRIHIMFDGVSATSGDDFLIQIGDSGGIETSGYVASSHADSGTSASNTTGFIIQTASATDLVTGHMTLTLMNAASFIWVSSHSAQVTSAAGAFGGGAKTLSAELTQLKLINIGGVAFDAGAVNISWEF